MCYFQAESLELTILNANLAPPSLAKYFNDNKLSLNMPKTQAIPFCLSQVKLSSLPSICGKTVDLVREVKLLGVRVDS